LSPLILLLALAPLPPPTHSDQRAQISPLALFLALAPAEVGRTPWSAAGPPASPSDVRIKFQSPVQGLVGQVGSGTLWVRRIGNPPVAMGRPLPAALFDIIDRIAVSVGNHVITTSDLDREIRVTAFLNDAKPDFTPVAKRATADRMVEQALVRTELETSRYPTPPPSEVDPILAQLIKTRFPNDAAFQRSLAEYGITEQDVRDALLWQRTLLSFLDVRFRPSVQVSDQEMEGYFNKVIKPTAPSASFGDYRDRIEEKLTGDREDQEMSRWLDQAKKRTEIVYHNDAL
jgi:hypothetical protein